MQILSLDPSLLHCGWAIMSLDNDVETLQSSGTIIVPTTAKRLSLEKRIWLVLDELNQLMLLGVKVILIEQPESWGAYKSLASLRSGSLLKLELLAGALVGWAFYKLGSDAGVYFIKVSTWKGQLPKEVTQERMETKYQCKFATNDEADAVGIGDWYLNRPERRTAS